jgi:hypothetical protein
MWAVVSPSNVYRNKLGHFLATGAVFQIIRSVCRKRLIVVLGLIPEKELSIRGAEEMNIEGEVFRAD